MRVRINTECKTAVVYFLYLPPQVFDQKRRLQKRTAARRSFTPCGLSRLVIVTQSLLFFFRHNKKYVRTLRLRNRRRYAPNLMYSCSLKNKLTEAMIN